MILPTILLDIYLIFFFKNIRSSNYFFDKIICFSIFLNALPLNIYVFYPKDIIIIIYTILINY
jgi:hypothetical protein